MNLDNGITAFAPFLGSWLSSFLEFSLAKLVLLAHPNRDYSKFLNYKQLRLKIKRFQELTDYPNDA